MGPTSSTGAAPVSPFIFRLAGLYFLPRLHPSTWDRASNVLIGEFSVLPSKTSQWGQPPPLPPGQRALPGPQDAPRVSVLPSVPRSHLPSCSVGNGERPLFLRGGGGALNPWPLKSALRTSSFQLLSDFFFVVFFFSFLSLLLCMNNMFLYFM